MMLLIRDKVPDAQRFPLVKFLERVYHLLGITPDTNLIMIKAWGYGLEICELEQQLENVESLTIKADFLLKLAQDTEQWFYDFDCHEQVSKLRFGLIDSGALFCEGKKDILDKISQDFKEVEIR